MTVLLLFGQTTLFVELQNNTDDTGLMKFKPSFRIIPNCPYSSLLLLLRLSTSEAWSMSSLLGHNRPEPPATCSLVGPGSWHIVPVIMSPKHYQQRENMWNWCVLHDLSSMIINWNKFITAKLLQYCFILTDSSDRMASWYETRKTWLFMRSFVCNTLF